MRSFRFGSVSRGRGGAAAGQNFSVVRGFRGTVHTASVSAEIAPLRIARTEQVAKFLAGAREPGLAPAAVASDQTRGGAVREIGIEARGQFLRDRLAHAAEAGGPQPCVSAGQWNAGCEPEAGDQEDQ